MADECLWATDVGRMVPPIKPVSRTTIHYVVICLGQHHPQLISRELFLGDLIILESIQNLSS